MEGPNRSTVGLVILGATLACGCGLFLGGCAVAGNYYPVFAIVPALLGIAAQVGIVRSLDPSYEPGWIGTNGWVFLLVIFLTSCLGLPLVISHASSLPLTAVALFIVGSLIVIGGYCAAGWLTTPDTE
jgi:hypothetical protein